MKFIFQLTFFPYLLAELSVYVKNSNTICKRTESCEKINVTHEVLYYKTLEKLIFIILTNQQTKLLTNQPVYKPLCIKYSLNRRIQEIPTCYRTPDSPPLLQHDIWCRTPCLKSVGMILLSSRKFQLAPSPGFLCRAKPRGEETFSYVKQRGDVWKIVNIKISLLWLYVFCTLFDIPSQGNPWIFVRVLLQFLSLPPHFVLRFISNIKPLLHLCTVLWITSNVNAKWTLCRVRSFQTFYFSIPRYGVQDKEKTISSDVINKCSYLTPPLSLIFLFVL